MPFSSLSFSFLYALIHLPLTHYIYDQEWDSLQSYSLIAGNDVRSPSLDGNSFCHAIYRGSRLKELPSRRDALHQSGQSPIQENYVRSFIVSPELEVYPTFLPFFPRPESPKLLVYLVLSSIFRF